MNSSAQHSPIRFRGVQLIGNLICPFSKRAHILLDDMKLAHERIDLDFTDKPEWLAQLNPEWKVPVLVDDQAVVFESRAILEYLNEKYARDYLPGSSADRATARGYCQLVEYVHDDVRAYFMAEAEQPCLAALQRVRQRLEVIAKLCPAALLRSDRLSLVGVYLGGLFVLIEALECGPHRLIEPGQQVDSLRHALTAQPAVKAAGSAAYRTRMLHFLAARKGFFTLHPSTQACLATLTASTSEVRADRYLNR